MVKELAGRLAALDPDAGAAVRVIAYFDRLVDSHAGLETIVRGAAVLSGCPARLADDERRIHVRVEPDGRRHDEAPPLDAGWLHAPVVIDGPGALWLERQGPAGAVDAMVLERASAAARSVLERTRGRSSTHTDDPAFLETLFDDQAPEQARLHAARRLGLHGSTPARALALADGTGAVEAVIGSSAVPATPVGARVGIGPTVAVLQLPASWAGARTAYRFTAEGTERDPGPRGVRFDELGGLVLLAAAVGPGSEPIPDVRAIQHAGSAAPWVLLTLEAIAATTSLRAAATVLTVHHSTLQDRLGQAEHLLGWSVHDPQGRLRLQLGLALRRLHRSASPTARERSTIEQSTGQR